MGVPCGLRGLQKNTGLQCYSKNFGFYQRSTERFKQKNEICMRCYVFLSDESLLMRLTLMSLITIIYTAPGF